MTSYVNLYGENRKRNVPMTENCDELSIVKLKIGQYVMYENEVGKFPKDGGAECGHTIKLCLLMGINYATK